MSGDFLMRRHNIGGVVSVMGFGSCFILMMQLLVSFLRSPLTAAFAKKLSQLALSMLPAGALVIVAPICNLLQWHPSINCLVHRVLVSLHQAVIPHLSNPFMSGDFLMRRHNISGVVSVMGFGSCFILMMQLLVSFLRSPLTAAFAKKLSQLALSMLPAGALVIVAPICNLLQWHPSINCLVHRESSRKKTATGSPSQSHRLLRLLLVASVLSATVPVALGDSGTASFYGPPYDRTACYGGGGGSSQFPESNLFAAVGDGLWDLGAACGREYEVRCTSGCKPGSGAIRVKTVDSALSVGPRQSVTGADLVLSQFAFEAIANPSMDSISVEFKRV